MKSTDLTEKQFRPLWLVPPLAPSCVQSSTLTNGELFKGETTFLSGEYIFFLQYSQNYILQKKNWNRLPSIKTHKQYYYRSNNKSTPTMNLLIFCGGGDEKYSWLIYNCEENVLQRFIFLKRKKKMSVRLRLRAVLMMSFKMSHIFWDDLVSSWLSAVTVLLADLGTTLSFVLSLKCLSWERPPTG